MSKRCSIIKSENPNNFLSFTPETDMRVFTDRINELLKFQDWLNTITADSRGSTVLAVTGNEQIGKSSLLLLFRKLTDEKNIKNLKTYYTTLGADPGKARVVNCTSVMILLKKDDSLIQKFFGEMQRGRSIASIKPELGFEFTTPDMYSIKAYASAIIERVFKLNPDYKYVFKKMRGKKIVIFIDSMESMPKSIGQELRIIQEMAAHQEVTDLHFIVAINKTKYERDLILKQLTCSKFELNMFSREDKWEYLQKLIKHCDVRIPVNFNVDEGANMREFKSMINEG